MSDERRFGELHLEGGRYKRPGLPVSVAEELHRYERLVTSVASVLYLRSHSDRQRVPRGFRQNFELRLNGIEDGSVQPVLVRPYSPALFDSEDYFDTARRVINDALSSVETNGSLSFSQFPEELLSEFSSFGRSLQEDEAIVFYEDGEPKARLDRSNRQRLLELADLNDIEVEATVSGQILGLSFPERDFDFSPVGEGRVIKGKFPDISTAEQLRPYFDNEERAPLVALTVVGVNGISGSLKTITDVLNVELALPSEWAERLATISRLKEGWLGPGSLPPAEQALALAEDLLLLCLDEGLTRPGIYPLEAGGVQLEWKGLRGECEVQITNEATILATLFPVDHQEDFEVETSDPKDALSLIRKASFDE